MDALEKAYAEHMQQDGWWTKKFEVQSQEHEVDIIAYNPHSGKQFYGNLTYLSHPDQDGTGS
jgi:hypothetical protein